jgi:hypothetical protein
VDEWIGELSKAEPVVTFCVYGFHIGCETAVTLRKAGFDARYMVGGHYAWKASKGPLMLLEDTSSSGPGRSCSASSRWSYRLTRSWNRWPVKT